MKSIGRGLRALAALGILVTSIWGAAAQGATPNGNRQTPARLANTGSSMRFAQVQAAQQPSATPAAQPQPMDDGADPFVDEAESVSGNYAPDSGDGLWQAPPALPTAGSNCGQNCWDNMPCCGGCAPRCGCWYGGADYLLAKAHFSQGYAAIVCNTANSTTTSPNVSTLTENAVPFPYRYSSMYRIFLGYHLSDCGGDINFTYWNLQSTAATTLGPANVTGGTNIIFGQVLNNPADGQYLNASSGIRINIYDVDFSKYLIYGGPGKPCDCNFCPRWDMRWFAGVRIAQVNRFDNNSITNADGSATAYGMVNANFYGAGPKIGIQARRYIGQSQRFSVYAKGSMSLLLGQFHGSRTQNIPGDSTTPTSITTAVDNTSRVIPVTDIEVGGSYQLYPQFFVSAGYFVQCWWDLGYGETIGTGAVTSFGALDTSNIMAWTGLFVRAEMFF
ncbi:MAG TPA: Lpg1974 family pore-forming outer membrane protein [Pirellulales bacterium]|jgi:hypothetical protein|nr:Lpg1974 family pore-forming outer membrane protein [Pirellulales bacterium]